MEIESWLKSNTFHHSSFWDLKKLVEEKERQGLKISLCIPALNEEKTIGKEIVLFRSELMTRYPLLDEIAIYSNASASYIYVLSFVHLLHVLGGILFLAGILIASRVGKKKGLSNLRLRLGSIYWHFVDGLWLYLLLFLLLLLSA